MKNTPAIFAFTIVLATLPSFCNAGVMIDLNDFFADPTVSVTANGSSAEMREDAFLSPVLLSNDPGLGEPEVVFAEINGNAQSLSFDYNFVEGVGSNLDEFFVYVLDASTGFGIGPSFEFSSSSTASGTVVFDLSSLAGKTLGLQFELNALNGDAAFDSTVTISDVQLNNTNAVPEPGSAIIWAAFVFGTGGLALRRRRMSRGIC